MFVRWLFINILLFFSMSHSFAQSGQLPMKPSAFDFSFTSIDGQDISLHQFQGKAMLVVNTASRCGFTPQYAGLQNLWARYRDQGLIVLAVPSDDFGGQELDSAKQVKEFCTVNFEIDFPMTNITKVKGSDAHDFYKWAGEQAGSMGKPKWNFHKYLIGRDGQLIDWFSSVTPPDSKKIQQAIETALKP